MEEEEKEKKVLEKMKDDFKEILNHDNIHEFYRLALSSVREDKSADLRIGISTAFNTLENMYFQEDTMLALPYVDVSTVDKIIFDFFKNFVDILKNEHIFDIINTARRLKNNNALQVRHLSSSYTGFRLENFVHNCQKLDRSINQKTSELYIKNLLQTLHEKYTEKYAEMKKIETRTKTMQQEIETKTKIIKEEIEALYSKAGITSFSKDYHNIAEEERKAKDKWLWATGICGAIAVIIALITLCQLFFSNTPINYFDRLPWALFLAISALWTAHKYSIARRNHLIYRHLATTLSTFKAFERPDDKKYQSLLLFEIAKVIFPPPIDKRTENQRELGNMIDLVKTISVQDTFKIKP